MISTSAPFSDYTLHTVLFVSKLANTGDSPLLRDMGLRDDQIERFRRLKIEDAWDLATHTHAPLTTIRFDPETIDLAFRSCERRRAENDQLDALILAGAPLTFINEWFGLSANDYTQRRRALGLDGEEGNGRPPKPAPAVEDAIWNAWQHHADLQPPERLLAVHRALANTLGDAKVTIRIIIAVLRDTHGDGARSVSEVLQGERHER